MSVPSAGLRNENMTLLEQLVDEYGNDVRSFAFSITRRRDMADDITQDVFIRAFQKLGSFRGESAIKAWLLRITRNVAYDYLRSSFIRKVTLVEFLTSQGVHPSAEQEGIDHLVTEEVWLHVLRLPTRLREVLVLYAHHGLSVQEIADLLNLTEGAVRARLHRARTRIAKLFKEGESNGTVRI